MLSKTWLFFDSLRSILTQCKRRHTFLFSYLLLFLIVSLSNCFFFSPSNFHFITLESAHRLLNKTFIRTMEILLTVIRSIAIVLRD